MRKSAFNLNPEIKREALWAGPFLRPASLLVERGGGGVRIRDPDGKWHDGGHLLRPHQHGLLRPLSGAELSDGTLRYLLWVAALLTPRPPALLVLNEPETSLHP